MASTSAFLPAFPGHSVLASRVALVALSEGWGEDYSEALYRAEFQEDGDVALPEVVGAVVARLGRDAGRVLLQAEAPEAEGGAAGPDGSRAGAGHFWGPKLPHRRGALLGGRPAGGRPGVGQGSGVTAQATPRALALTPAAASP